MLTVQVDNLDDAAFQGSVRLVDVSGIEPARLEQPLQSAAGETNQSLCFPLTSRPAGECRIGLRIEDDAGNQAFTLTSRRFVFLPDHVLPSCRVLADGDPQVASELSIAAAAAPEPLPDSEAPVLRISYDFGDGWKFLRVAPKGGGLPGIAGKLTGFGFWVYGDGRRTSPRLRVRDTTGQTWQPTGREIDWKGWRYVELPLTPSSGHWGGADDGQIHFPLVWDSIFLLDNPPRKRNRGTVYIAAPVILY